MSRSTPFKSRTSLFLLLSVLGSGAAFGAVAVPVDNPGFEADALGSGGIRTTITGWATSAGGGDGIFRPTTSDYPGGIPDGENVAYVNLPGNSVRQVLATPLAANTRYTLTVEVGWNRNDPFAGYLVQLRAGGTVLAEDASSQSPAQGEWVTSTVEYTSGAADPEIGARLEIWLLTPGIQANYDDVRLTAEGLVGEVVPLCHDVTVRADPEACTAAHASIDAGSFETNGRPVTLSQDPPAPYPVGETLVTLTVVGPEDTGTCQGIVTVVDGAAAVVECNAPETITPPDAPISFTATATDNCGVSQVVIVGFDCWTTNGAGKRVDKTGSCVVSIEGDTLTVHDSGGVGDVITWLATATDGAGNPITRSCTVEVVRPGKGKGRR